MTTKKQIESNRKNALKSTGPKTPEGKAIVGRNAVKYGLYSKALILKGGLVAENPQEFEELLQGLIDDLQPVGPMETILVEKIAASCWRLKRLFRAECGSIKTGIIESYKSRVYDDSSPHCPISIHQFVNQDNISIGDLTDEFNELSKKLELDDQDLQKDDDFQELFQEKYPNKKIKDLSVHQLKRLKSAFRSNIREMMREKAQLLRYVYEASPQHQNNLVPNEKITRYGTTLERSLLRDLSALKQLQTMRKVD